LIYFASTRDLRFERSAECFAISVAKIQPINLFLNILNSSGVKVSKKLDSALDIKAEVSAAW
jgi:hypothetical protein